MSGETQRSSDQSVGIPREARVNRWAYFPFGAGTRIRLGGSLAELVVRLVIATVLQRYIPKVLPGHRIEPVPLITLHVKHGLPARLEAAPQATLVSAGRNTDVSLSQRCPYE